MPSYSEGFGSEGGVDSSPHPGIKRTRNKIKEKVGVRFFITVVSNFMA
jgi:hypothetical protein